ncbi:hypothetical protein I302_100185 [Kwoniella bestiolae CBS 10118]|uniref:Uncharacterized protein n=1 Tax=Kwoniella bestiolae CBS 10118 TaxID=1296100 RepID=A0AAJ8JZY3_9TREE
MGRSAKFTKRPSKEAKARSKIAQANSKPVPPPRSPSPTPQAQGEEEGKSKKKRKLMRAKVDKVGSRPIHKAFNSDGEGRSPDLHFYLACE